MSGLAGLYNVPHTLEEWQRWSFVHVAHHRDLNRLIFRTKGVLLPDFPLDPPGDLDAMLAMNQQLHAAMDAVLGIPSFPLEGLDPRDEASLETWIAQHGSEHARAAQLLGIG